MHKESNRPIGENSSNLVTLPCSVLANDIQQFKLNYNSANFIASWLLYI
jgi:hypothetical protein